MKINEILMEIKKLNLKSYGSNEKITNIMDNIVEEIKLYETKKETQKYSVQASTLDENKRDSNSGFLEDENIEFEVKKQKKSEIEKNIEKEEMLEEKLEF